MAEINETEVATQDAVLEVSPELIILDDLVVGFEKDIEEEALGWLKERESWPETYQSQRSEIYHYNSYMEGLFNLLKRASDEIKPGEKNNATMIFYYDTSSDTHHHKSVFTKFLTYLNEESTLLVTNENERGELEIIDTRPQVTEEEMSHGHVTLPKLFQDIQMNLIYFDCPVVKEYESTNYDVANAFFLKKITDRVSAVKIIYLLNYDKLHDNDNLEEFLHLLRHGAQFVKDVSYYASSITVVLTNVDISIDEQIAKQTAFKFFKDHESYLIKQVERDSKWYPDQVELTRNELKFLQVLMKNEGELFGIFRKPNEIGMVSDLEMYQQNKEELFELIQNRLQFTFNKPNSFGYFLTQEHTKIYLNEILNNLMEKITTLFNEVVDKAWESFQKNEIDSSMNYFVLEEKITFFHEIVATMESSLSTITDPKVFLKNFIHHLEKTTILIPSHLYLSILVQINYIEFIKLIGGKTPKLPISEWLNTLKSLTSNLEVCKNWFDLLYKLYNEFSKDKYIKDKTRYNVKNLGDWSKLNRPQGLKIDENNFYQFLGTLLKFQVISDLNENKIVQFKNINHKKLPLIRSLNELIDITLKSEPKISCVKNNLIATGSFIFVSDVLKQQKVCSNLESIKIYAVDTIYIDEDIDLSEKEVTITFIAPNWKISDTDTKRVINLNGKTGANIVPFQAQNSTVHGRKGDDGLPGNPGGPSGQFFGIGKKIENGYKLNIYAKAGNGGNGQMGGNGKSGVDGTKIDKDWYKQVNRKNGFKDQIEKLKKRDHIVTVQLEKTNEDCGSSMYLSRTCDYYHYKITTKNRWGEKGGDGGDGGKGGNGGLAGYIKIINFDSNPTINLKVENGTQSNIGPGGHQAYGGSNEGIYLYHCTKTYSMSTQSMGVITNEACSLNMAGSSSFGTSGKPGKNNSNEKNRQPAKPPKIFNVFDDINEYKSIIREKYDDKIQRHIIEEFLQDIESNEEINEVYNTIGYLNELRVMEEQYLKFRDHIDFLPYYQSLAKRIENYSKNRKENEKTDEYTKILRHLYALVLSKIVTYSKGREPNLIIDIKGHLEITKQSIQSLGKIKNKIEKENETKNYKKRIDEKIEEAENLISTELLTEVDHVYKTLNQNVEALVSEVKVLQKKAQENKEKLIKERKKLESSIGLKRLFGSLKIVSQVLGFLGPYGKAASGILDVGSGIAESFVMKGDDDKYSKIAKQAIPKSIIDSLGVIEGGIKNFKEKKEKSLKKQIKEIKEGIETNNKDKEFFKDVKNFLIEMEKKIEKKPEKTDDEKLLDDIEKQQNDLDKELKKKKEALEKDQKAGDEKAKERLKKLEHFQNIAKVGKACVDEYLQHEKDEEAIKAIANSIDQENENIDNLHKYERGIYKTLAPLIDDMRKNINGIQEKLGSQSKVALNVINWKVQKSLNEVKNDVAELTKERNIGPQFQYSINRLQEAMTTMINIYDQIQNYEEHKKLVDYLSLITSEYDFGLKIKNQNLEKSVQDLDIVLRKNVILGDYDAVVNAFKQWVFPFAKIFISDFYITNDPSKTTLDNYVQQAVTNIDDILNKISRDSTFINQDRDPYLIDANYTTEMAFYNWKKIANKFTINKLLSGQTVFLKAHVQQNYDQDAVKFKSIMFNFIYEPNQDEFNKVLNKFKIEFTHMGNSFYRCGHRFYRITTPSQHLSYSFDTALKNHVGIKLSNGDIRLSPYTMWQVKISPKIKSSLSLLARFKNKVDLQLIGQGTYVDDKAEVCTDLLDKYYTRDYTIDDTVYGIDIDNDLDELIHDENIKVQSTEERNIIPPEDVLEEINDLLIEIDDLADNSIEENQSSRRKRSVERCATSKASSNLNSPINNLINWIAMNIVLIKVFNPLKIFENYFSTSFLSNNVQNLNAIPQKNSKENFNAFENQFDNKFDAQQLFNYVDNCLILAPIFLHYWEKLFSTKVKKSIANSPQLKPYQTYRCLEALKVLNCSELYLTNGLNGAFNNNKIDFEEMQASILEEKINPLISYCNQNYNKMNEGYGKCALNQV